MIWRGNLFFKYAIPLVVLVMGGLVISGLVEIYFSYQENKSALARIQHEKAAAAAIRIERFVRELEHDLSWIAQTPWGPRGVPIDQRRLDSLRLLRQVPAITEVSHIDTAGHEQLRVSRLAMDVIGSNADLSRDSKFVEAMARKTYFSPVYFRKESEPYITIAMAGAGEDAGVVAAEANLKFIWDVVSNLKVGKGGNAYVVDERGRLIAHPDISLVLQKTDLSTFPQVRAAAADPAGENDAPAVAMIGRDVRGTEVLSAHANITPLGWSVFVELPINEAFASLYASIWRTVILVLVGVVISIVASLYLVRRMVAPVQALRAGAARIGAGALDHRIAVQSGDELQALADEFNRMTERLQESYRGLERKVEERTRDLTDALEQQTATSEILRVISQSQTDAQPVFDAIAERARVLCGAEHVGVTTYDGQLLHIAALSNVRPEGAADLLGAFPRPPGRETAVGSAILDRTIVAIPDVTKYPQYGLAPASQTVTFRSVMAVPMLREGNPIGVISIMRAEAGSFGARETELLKTFADQAVIAIENVRLFKELEERNKALTESLEQQTATAEVLQVIASSPNSEQPVFEAILRSGVALCEPKLAAIFRFDGTLVHLVASHDWSTEARDWGEQKYPVTPTKSLIGPRTILTKAIVEVRDTYDDPDYDRAAAQTGGWRRMLGVPLLREGQVLGSIVLAWPSPGETPRSQVELIKTFADQAVIAIENVRLFKELQERTHDLARSVGQLQALTDVSQAVNSTLDLEEVLSAIVTRAVQLSSTDSGAVYEHDEVSGELRLRATYGIAPELVDALLSKSIRVGEGATGKAAEERTTVEIPDIKNTDSYSGTLRDVIERAEVRSVLSVPLLREGRVLGGLTVSRKIAGNFPPGVIEILQTFAAQSAIAIQNARLFRELEQKGHELQVASQHKSQFLANMSHELRTPLNAILGYTELIVDQIYGEVPKKISDVLERVQKSGRHLLGLINDVLDLSKIEAGQLTLSLSDYSFQDAVQSVVASVESLANEKGLRLTADVTSKLPVGRADERRIVQVLLNLVGNAIKFTDSGEVKISVSAKNDSFEVSVSDTGPGIPEGQHERIFEEFQQVDGSSTRTKGGTGLGLAIAKKIIGLHGGRIWVESIVGKGSTFTFSLPVRAERREEVA